jgi:ATP-binding cassette subfamily F protein 3
LWIREIKGKSWCHALKFNAFEVVMLQVKDLGKAFRGEWLFRSVSFHINERDRIGLVGDNGSGKTTLMKMLARLCPTDEGETVGARNLTFGYLPQDGLFVRGQSVFEEVLSVYGDIRSLEDESRELEQELAQMKRSDPEYEKTLDRYATVSQQFRLQEGYTVGAKVGAVLNGLGFRENDWHRPCEEFSGGWQMRIALAKLLLQQPRLLLLDEPTNHLDLEARNWFEAYLQDYPHALVLVSHDRFFLNSTIQRIVEIQNRSVSFYKGNYDEFLMQREERIAQLVAAHEAQQREIARLKAFADKFRYKKSKAAQVQSRLKEIDRMERIEIPPESKRIHFRFPEGPRTGKIVLELYDVTAGYGEAPVFRELNLMLERGERVALVGPNGAGKSTLIKMLAGRLPLSRGERKEGSNVVVSYFSQDQDSLLESRKTVWEEVFSVAPNYIVPQLRTLLGCFLFSGDSIEKPVSVLSGGERSRLELCRLLLSPANCLLLDEPTNHLDIRSKDILMDSLQAYGGSTVFVSHDRYFLDGLATKIWEVGQGTVIAYLGNYADYLFKKEAESVQETKELGTPAGPRGVSGKGRQRSQKKTNPLKIQQVRDTISRVEAEIEIQEDRMKALSQSLSSEQLYQDYNRFRTTMAEQNELQESLNRLMKEWEQLQADLEIMVDGKPNT